MRNELLIKLLTVLVLRIQSILLLLPYVLQRTLIVAALADMDELVARRLRRCHLLLLLDCLLFGQAHFGHFHLVLSIADPAGFHHARLIHEATLTRVKAYSRITSNSGQAATSGML